MTERIDEKPTPDGAISGILYEFSLQIEVAERHAAAEGHAVLAETVLDSYDRQLHPWLHGRRPSDLVAFARGLLESIWGDSSE